MSQQNFPYRTQQLQMSTVIFQSMINNLGNRIRKMNIQLHFKTENEKSAFMVALQRNKQRQQNQIQLGESDDEAHENAHQQPNNIIIKKQSQLDKIVIEEPFQKSILLREKFMDKFKEIGKRLGVTFMVVPNKVKISGIIRDRVDDAQDQYREIQQNICFQPIDKYGREVYQSKYFKTLLKEHKVQIIEILRKYYLWFLKNQSNPKEVLRDVFMKTKHAFYQLHQLKRNEKEAIASGQGTAVLGDIQYIQTGERISDNLYVRVRSRIFELVISKKLNTIQDRKDRQVELSQDRKGLLLHLDAEEQMEIQKQIIEEEYSRYKYIFFVFHEKIQMCKIANILQSINFNEKLIWQIVDNYVCLSFVDQSPFLQEEIQKHPLFVIIGQIPKQLLDFRLGISDNISLPQESEWNFLTQDRDPIERITRIGVKSMMRKSYQKMMKLYLQNKLSAQYLIKNKEEKTNKTTSQMPFVEASLDISQPINESTQFLVNQIDKTVVNQNLDTSQDTSHILSSIISFRFQNYAILLSEAEQDREKKFFQDVQKIQKFKLPFRNNEYENKMKDATSFNYKFFKVKISKQHIYNMKNQLNAILEQKPQLGHLNRWVTVFAGSKQGTEFNDLYQREKKLKVVKIEKNYKIKQGFLITTNLIFLFVEENNDQLPYGRYQPICFIRKVE